MLRLIRAYASRDLVLALGFSSALHAAVLSSLEAPVPGFAGAPTPALSVRLREEQNLQPARSVPRPSEPRSAGRSARAVLPLRYLPAHAVDTPARAREIVPLVYPQNALIWRLGGVVRLRVLINEQGTVDEAQILSAEPEGEFEQAALDAVRRLVYDPALRNGRSVASEKVIEVTFDPHETPRQ